MTVHHFIYQRLAALYPKLKLRALTDDLTSFSAPADPEDADQWHALYEEEARFLEDYDRLGGPIGIVRHPGKGRLLLPPCAPDPKPDCKLLQYTQVVRDVACVGGGHIGSEQSCLQGSRL